MHPLKGKRAWAPGLQRRYVFYRFRLLLWRGMSTEHLAVGFARKAFVGKVPLVQSMGYKGTKKK